MTNKNHKFIFAAGGTGGHVFPAIAVADAIRKQDPDAQILFVGASHGRESEWIPKAGYEFRQIDVGFLTGQNLLTKIKHFFKFFKAALQCRKILKQERPNAVIGSGGYVSGPMLFMAALTGYFTIILEQNAILGLTNRILSRFVDKILLSFPIQNHKLDKKAIHIGNPVRNMLSPKSSLPKDENKLNILVFGGSQGALALNINIPKALKELSPEHQKKLSIQHQTGKSKLDECLQNYKDCPCQYECMEFIDDMAAYYQWCDLIICRAGATGLAEIQTVSKPAILVPFPFAAHNHQEKNADFMVEKNASWKILNQELESTKLSDLLTEILNNPEILKEKALNTGKLAKPDAANKAAQIILEHAKDI